MFGTGEGGIACQPENIDMRAFAKDEALHTVIYHGTEAQWEKILISGTASDNQYLLAAERRCLKEEPAGYQKTNDNSVADHYEEMVYCVKKRCLTAETVICIFSHRI